jgi:MFS family permease
MAEALQNYGRLNWKRRWPALTYANYRLYFMGQVVSLLGTWMQATAQGFLIFQLTHSPAFLGYVAFAGGAPTWLFTLYGGVIADRVPRRTLMVITQSCMMILAFVLAILAFTQLVQPWHIIALAFLLGICNAFDAPARQAFTLEMVDRADLTNAIALNATMFNSGTAVGPAIAGFTYALFGPAWCFLINGLSFLAVIAALLKMKLRPFVALKRGASTFGDLKEGLLFSLRNPTVRTLMLVASGVNLFAMAYATLIPAWAVEVLHGDAATNGLMQSARGVGSLISALMLASMGRVTFKGKIVTIGTFALPIMILIYSQVTNVQLSLFMLMLIGLSFMPVMNVANALVQTEVPDALRGRVMSIWTLVFFGMMPLCGLWAGTTAHYLGEPTVVVIGGGVALLIAIAVFVFFPRIRALE